MTPLPRDARAKKFADFYGTQEFDDLFWSEIPHHTDDFLAEGFVARAIALVRSAREDNTA